MLVGSSPASPLSNFLSIRVLDNTYLVLILWSRMALLNTSMSTLWSLDATSFTKLVCRLVFGLTPTIVPLLPLIDCVLSTHWMLVHMNCFTNDLQISPYSTYLAPNVFQLFWGYATISFKVLHQVAATYSMLHKGYQCYDIVIGEVVVTCYVTFNETNFPFLSKEALTKLVDEDVATHFRMLQTKPNLDNYLHLISPLSLNPSWAKVLIHNTYLCWLFLYQIDCNRSWQSIRYSHIFFNNQCN